MSKHAPWEIEWGSPIAIGDGIAFVPQSLDGSHTANARLIAAAPALLEALQALTHALDEADLVHDDQRKAFKDATALIARATGETA